MLNKMGDDYICHWPITFKVMRGQFKSLFLAEYIGNLIWVPKG